MKEQKFREIIDRIEQRRIDLGLNKSKFVKAFGMKPQSYNNFIGAQGSKPNIELILGVVNEYGMDPMYLLNGENGKARVFKSQGITLFKPSRAEVVAAQKALNKAVGLYLSALTGQNQ